MPSPARVLPLLSSQLRLPCLCASQLFVTPRESHVSFTDPHSPINCSKRQTPGRPATQAAPQSLANRQLIRHSSPLAETPTTISSLPKCLDYRSSRERDESCVGQGSKAIREKMRRDKMNERFLELSKLLESGRPAKSDKFAILDDAIRILNELKADTLELKEKHQKLEEEVATLKEEKNELKEEKSSLKAEKERMEGCFRTPPPIFAAGYMPPHPVAYHPLTNKMMTFPNYGAIPMWQFLPPSARDVSKDHELRPPMA